MLLSRLNIRQTVVSLFNQLNPLRPQMAEEASILFKRLKVAQQQARALQIEINDIAKKIQVLREREIFKQHLDDFGSDFSDHDEESQANELPKQAAAKKPKRSVDQVDNPPNKKPRFENGDNDYVTVYTDGACENNGRALAKAGIGIWFGEDHPWNVSKPVEGKATNNTAEIQACIGAVQLAIDNNIPKLKIKTDSNFTIMCMTQWIHRWKKNNWKIAGGGDVKNRVDLQKLDALCNKIDVQWEHVRGHQGEYGNEEADKLARQGAQSYQKC